MNDLTVLPPDLPVPVDDGACMHLVGQRLPDLVFTSTIGDSVNLAHISGWIVVFCYPMTGRPDTQLPDGWNAIPGARGCTPQACAFREDDHAFQAMQVQVYGLSAQSNNDQREAAHRLHLPFPLLSDPDLQFASALELPTFDIDGLRLYKRQTLIVKDGVIRHNIYPVFPPNQNSADVLAWLKAHHSI
jgi:peroxiredoxin